MILKSTSNHHPLNMRLLLIALTCLGAAIAAPQLKQKRDILPGDPRYGTDYHHHHHHHPETVEVETTRSLGGYVYSIPDTPLQLPQEIYGPPHYQPELPLNNEYLPPTIVTPGPSYGEPIGVNAPLEIAPEEPTIVDVKTVSSTPLPLEQVQHVTQPPLTTSYGTPVDEHVKTAVRTSGTPLKTVKTEIHGHSTLDQPKSVLKVKEQLRGTTHVTTELKRVPSVTSTLTKNYVSGSLINKSVPTLHSVGLFPTFNAVSHTPSVFDHQTTLTGAHADFSGYGTGLTSIHGVSSAHLGTPLTSLDVKNVPTFHPSHYQTYGFPDTKFQHPESLTHFEQHVAPTVNTFEAVTPTPVLHTVKSVETLSHPVHNVHSYQTHVHQPLQHTLTHVEPVHTVKTLDTLTHQPLHHTLTHVEPVHTVKTLDTLTHQPLHHTLTHVEPVHTVKTLDTLTHQPLHHTLTHVEPVHTVKTLDTLTHQPLQHTLTHVEPVHTEKTLETTVHHVPTFHSYQPVQTYLTLPTVQPLTSVKSVDHVESLNTVHHLQPVTSVKSVKTVTPLHHVESLNTVHHLQPVTSVKSVKTVTPVHHVDSVNTVHHLQPVTSVKSVKTVTPVHHVESVHTHPIESVETLHHPIDSVDILPAVQRTHTYTNTGPVYQKNVNVHVQKDVFSDFFSSIAASLPTLPTLPNLPQLPQLPSLPSFQFPTVQTTTAKPEVSTVVNTYVSEDHARDSVTVDNPLFNHDNLPSHVTQHVTPSKEYVQPTDENGGYIY